MINLSGISLHFGGRTLYDNISFQINAGERIGLAGRNGSGKSTLLRIIAGELRPNEGIVSTPNEYKIGFLAQDLDINSDKTVLDEAYTSFEEVMSLEKKIDHLHHEISMATETESEQYYNQLNDLSNCLDRYSLIGGYEYKEKTEKILAGLGFKASDFNKPMKQLSGGWQMRVELAKIILQEPDLLLLDEPTNHLDIESILWLEEWLKNHQGALILISHDKAFLDNVTNRTVEIEMGKLHDYKANYSTYLSQREERREVLLNSFHNQQKQIEHTEKLIDKFRAKANKAKFAQSLIKALDRMDLIELDETDTSALRIKFQSAPASGKIVFEIKNLSKAYERMIIEGINMEIMRGDRIAFVGKNGEGKSTLSKILANVETATSGDCTIGYNVAIGYLAQNQPDMLDTQKSVLEIIEDEAPPEIRPMTRKILGAFLFSNDAVEKKVKVLSGGERSRLAMAKLLLRPYNFLILDEPTNHLDIKAKGILKQALMDFNGTLLIVSHDREFLQGLCSKTYEFKDGNVKEYLGDINYFLEKKRMDDMRSVEFNYAIKEDKIKTNQNLVEKSEIHRNEIKEAKRKQIQKEKLEQEIALLENKIAAIEEQLKDPELYKNNASNQELYKSYEALKNELESKMMEWMEWME